MNWHFEEAPQPLLSEWTIAALIIFAVLAVVATVFWRLDDRAAKKEKAELDSATELNKTLLDIKRAKERYDGVQIRPLRTIARTSLIIGFAVVAVAMIAIFVRGLAISEDVNGNNRYESLQLWMDETYDIDISYQGAISLYNTAYGIKETTVAVNYKGEDISIKLTRSGTGTYETYSVVQVTSQESLTEPLG